MRLRIQNDGSDGPRKMPNVTETTGRRLAWCSGVLLIVAASGAPAWSQSPQTPQSRLRPIGEPSAVDQFSQAVPQRSDTRETASQVVTAQWVSPRGTSIAAEEVTVEPQSPYSARMQFQLPPGGGTTAPPTAPPSDASLMSPPSLSGQSPSPFGAPVAGTLAPGSYPPGSIPPGSVAPGGVMPGAVAPGAVMPGSLPPGSYTPPPTGPVYAPSTQPVVGGPGTAPPANLSPVVTPPRGLPMNPGPIPMTPMAVAPPRGDLLPVTPPQLNDQYATIANCSCVSPPSGYVAATPWPRPPANRSYPATPPPAYISNRAAVVAAPVIPDASTSPEGSGIPKSSLFSLGQDRNPVVLGQGIIGQPVAFVPGQPIRNSFRYLFP